jgi:hypothetical protein
VSSALPPAGASAPGPGDLVAGTALGSSGAVASQPGTVPLAAGGSAAASPTTPGVAGTSQSAPCGSQSQQLIGAVGSSTPQVAGSVGANPSGTATSGIVSQATRLSGSSALSFYGFESRYWCFVCGSRRQTSAVLAWMACRLGWVPL